MEVCDVLVVGGGPAGSTCAGRLRQAGYDVLLLDRERFPRPKPCAGWITPEVITVLALDVDEYRQGRVLQEISSFRTGLMNGTTVDTSYGSTVSYGIRRYEFDHYLLQRSGVRLQLGEAATTLNRKDGWWLVNGHIRARMLVGAGGHFCPVARLLGAHIGHEDVVVAQAAEFAMSREEELRCTVQPETPVLFFCRDMKGYGWLFRKGRFLNIGLGRMDSVGLARHTRDFCTFLKHQGDLPAGFTCSFQGHAYRLYGGEGMRGCVSDGALLIGDAAGLAHPLSGEGIFPAIESALLAADTIIAAGGNHERSRLEPYASGLAGRYSAKGLLQSGSPLYSGLFKYLGSRLISNSWFARHVVLDSWFLHANQKTHRNGEVHREYSPCGSLLP